MARAYNSVGTNGETVTAAVKFEPLLVRYWSSDLLVLDGRVRRSIDLYWSAKRAIGSDRWSGKARVRELKWRAQVVQVEAAVVMAEAETNHQEILLVEVRFAADV